jgi:hypothetical protein
LKPGGRAVEGKQKKKNKERDGWGVEEKRKEIAVGGRNQARRKIFTTAPMDIWQSIKRKGGKNQGAKGEGKKERYKVLQMFFALSLL